MGGKDAADQAHPDGAGDRAERIEAIRAQLEAVSEALADLALAELRDAVERAEHGPVAAERRLSRARRAVERAAGLLSEAD